MAKLTTKVDVPFQLCFRYKLQKGFSFENLQKDNLKALQGFLDKVSQMTVDQVDKLYGRKPDKQDIFNGQQVKHYEVNLKFRIHGINESGYFKVIRLDPNHEVHD